MLKALLIKRVTAIVLPIVVTSVIPWVLKDRPVLLWTANHVLPVIVEGANITQDPGKDSEPLLKIDAPGLDLAIK